MLALALLGLALGPVRALAAPGDMLFSDNFDDGGLAPWQTAMGEVGVNGDTSQSGTQSMYLGEGGALVASPTIDTDAPAVRLALWIRRGDDSFSEDPDAGEDLALYYIDENGVPQQLETFAGDGTPGQIYDASYDLPADARHPDFELWLYQTDGQTNADYWHVDDVRVFEPEPSVVAEYRMDENAWNGTSGEVIDHSGSGRDGTAQNGASTSDSSSAISGDPGTCGYGTFDGANDYVEVAGLSDVLDGTATMTFWIRTTQTGSDAGWQAPGVAGVEESGGADDIFWGWIDASGKIGISVGNDYEAEHKSSTAINDGAWHHVALSRDASTGETNVYVDGSLESTGTAASGIIGNNFSSIGRIEDTAGSPEYFAGDLDELRVYDGVLTTSEIQSVMNTTRACSFSCPSSADFSDDFEDGGLSPWQSPGGGGGSAGVSTHTQAHGSYSMYLQGGAVAARSPNIDLASADSANLSLWARRGSDDFSNHPEAGEALELQYRTDANSWATLETFPGGGTAGEIFERSYDLPNDALHPNFRFRFNLLGGSGGNLDYWHVDDICLAATGTGSAHHFAVTHDGSAVTCGEEQITITAHNAGDKPKDPGNVATTLATSTGEGTWARVITGSGTLSDTTAGDGAATYTWPGNGETSVTLAFNYTSVTEAEDPETVNFDIAGGNEGAGEDPNMVVSRSGLRFTDGSGDAISVPGQIAGKPSDTNPGAATLALQAVRAADNDPSVCVPYFPSGGDVEVELGAECNDPAICAGSELNVTSNGNTTAIVTSDDNGTSGAPGYEAVTLRFGANAEAPLVLAYGDAGRIQLHARYNAIDDGTATPPVVEYVTGSSNVFAVRPFGFEVAIPDDTADTGPDGLAPFTAGAPFTATVTARAWQAGDDSDGDGLPDAGANLADNPATPNFGNETTPETVDLAATVAAPTGGADGALTNATFDAFSGGASTRNDVAWSEVGYVDLSAALSDDAAAGTEGVYLTASGWGGAGAHARGEAGMVGRFIPADFDVAVRQAGVYEAACSSAFTYVGQPFGYAVTPRLAITARSATGTTTTNYRDAYNKLVGDDVTVNAPTSDAAAIGRDSGTTDVAVTSTVNGGAMADDGDGDEVGDGEIIYTFAASDSYAYEKVENARIDAFSSALPLEITDVTDSDGVSDGALPGPFTPGAAQLRFGRLVIDSAGGAEIAPIDMPLRAEYWNDGTWRVNDLDDCTALTLATEAELANESATVPGDESIAVGGGTTGITSPSPLTLSGGMATATFSAPGEDNTGWVDLRARLTAGSPDHAFLRGDPEGDGSWTSDPEGRVTFGIYSGSDRWIDLRRVPVN